MSTHGHDIIVIGASAGGMPALRELCSALPRGLPASIFIVWHMSPLSPGVLPDVLNQHCPLPAAFAKNGDAIQPGCIYVAPPDRHMLLTQRGVMLTDGPRENLVRPSVDPLFRSAARYFGKRVVGVILTGALDDGTEGLMYVKRYGGVTIAQDPSEATVSDM